MWCNYYGREYYMGGSIIWEGVLYGREVLCERKYCEKEVLYERVLQRTTMIIKLTPRQITILLETIKHRLETKPDKEDYRRANHCIGQPNLCEYTQTQCDNPNEYQGDCPQCGCPAEHLDEEHTKICPIHK